MVSNKMRDAGNQLSEELIAASISKNMGGFGGALTFDEFINKYEGTNLDLIQKYCDNQIDSITAIYIAMHRASILN